LVVNELYRKAQKTIEANILKYPEASFVTAGGNQFKTLWVRDFCYSVPGLLALEYSSLVKKQLQLILQYRHQNGFLPRGLDVMAPQLRVVLNLLFKKLSFYNYPENHNDFKSRITPEYFGEHKTVAFDSNILFVLAYLKYAEKTSDHFISPDALLDLLNVYQSYYSDGFFVQPPFSDWQDSACRSEAMLLFQIQFLSVLKKLDPELIKKLKFIDYVGLSHRVQIYFFDQNKYLFFHDKQKQQMS
jgi:glycogen debranching enzyme